jgi:hypothetical protein
MRRLVEPMSLKKRLVMATPQLQEVAYGWRDLGVRGSMGYRAQPPSPKPTGVKQQFRARPIEASGRLLGSTAR